jgi:predicted DNA-binding protein
MTSKTHPDIKGKHFQFSPELNKALRVFAAEKGITQASVVRQALWQYIKFHSDSPIPFDDAEFGKQMAAGLIKKPSAENHFMTDKPDANPYSSEGMERVTNGNHQIED